MKRHDFKYEKNSIKQVEMLLPKLKFAVLPSTIIKWLENFEADDVIHALDILKLFEYITFNEFMLRINYQLNELFKKIPLNERVIFYPYGKVGKSGTLVTYPLRNTVAYKKRQSQAIKEGYIKRNEEYNLITHDFEMINNPHDYSNLIFLDDFIGSGKTFIKEYNKPELQKWIKEQNINNIFLLSSITMEEGKDAILNRDNNIKIFSEIRYKLLSSKHSPLKLFNNRNHIKRIVQKYGQIIKVTVPPKLYSPLGYDNSEALIAFFHGTPNNTIPLIWGTDKWEPLFPRKADIRMSESKRMKKEIVYYLSICDKLGINIISGSEYISNLNNDKRTLLYQKLNEQNHSIVALIYLKALKYEDIFICQIFGLTLQELRSIYIEGINKGLIDKISNELTNEAEKLLKKLKNLSNKEKIRAENKENLSIKNYLYLPQTFDGMT